LEVPNVVNLKKDLNQFDDVRIAYLFSYPLRDVEIGVSRIKYLSKLGIDRIFLWGNTKLYGINVLGKGKSSIVVLAGSDKDLLVLKVSRLDSSVDRLANEYNVLTIIHEKYGSEKMAPRPLFFKNGILGLEYINGYSMEEFLSEYIYLLSLDELRHTLYRLFYKAFLLDKLGVDHGELSRPFKHIIFMIDDYEPVLIDFESASIHRKVKNLTSLIQAMVVRSNAASYIRELFGINYNTVIPLLRLYRNNLDEQSFRNIVKIFNLTH